MTQKENILKNSPNKIKYYGCDTIPAVTLIAGGWKLRYTGEKNKIKELIHTYVEMGYEVKTVPFTVENLRDECCGCKKFLNGFHVLYTRKINNENGC